MKHIAEAIIPRRESNFVEMKQAITAAARNENPTELRTALQKYAPDLYEGQLELLCNTNFEIVQEAARKFSPWDDINIKELPNVRFWELHKKLLPLASEIPTEAGERETYRIHTLPRRIKYAQGFRDLIEDIFETTEACINDSDDDENSTLVKNIGLELIKVLNGILEYIGKCYKQEEELWIALQRAEAVRRFVYRPERPAQLTIHGDFGTLSRRQSHEYKVDNV